MAVRVHGSGGRRVSEINVTPLIDVLLVLLIVFMVMQQELRRGLSLQVPPPEAAVEPAIDPIVLEVEPGGLYRLNREPVPPARLQARLAEVYAGRPQKVIFVQGSTALSYGELIQAVDVSRAAGVQVVGLVPRPVADR